MQAIQSATQAYGAAHGLSALNLNGMEMSSPKTALQESGSSQTFGDMVDHAIKRLENQTIGTDQTAVNLAKGEANIVDVVTAVAETELALETLISVRDQVISSYQEVLRMPI